MFYCVKHILVTLKHYVNKHYHCKCSGVFQGAGVFCIMTKLIITENQFQGKCAEVRMPISTGYQSLSMDFKIYRLHSNHLC